jgi:hypothetical protein
MKLTPAIFGLLVIGLLPASFALADIPPTPRDLPPGKNYERLEVKVDAAKDMSFLRIPRSALNDAGLDFRDKKSSKVGATSPSHRKYLRTVADSAQRRRSGRDQELPRQRRDPDRGRRRCRTDDRHQAVAGIQAGSSAGCAESKLRAANVKTGESKAEHCLAEPS